MKENDELSKKAIVTKSGKQIMLHNDLERVFSVNQTELVSPFLNKETPQDFRNQIYLTSPGDLGLRAPYSPMFYGVSYSPMKVGGVSFYDTFSKNSKTPRPLVPANPVPVPSRGVSKFEGVIPDLLDPFDREPLAPNPNSINKQSNAALIAPHELQTSTLQLANYSLAVSNDIQPTFNEPSSNNFDSPSENIALADSIKTDTDISKYGNNLGRLKGLYKVLNKIFNHRAILLEEYVTLNPFEEDLVNSVLQRKFLKKLRPRDLDLEGEKKIDLINEIINTKSHKRPEECYKFVLTRVIKHLKKYLKGLGTETKDLEAFFYEYYFRDTSLQLGLPLNDFHYPLTGDKSKFKLNSKYFDRIFKSHAFLDRLKIYMNGLLERDYRIEIAKKLDSLLQRWDQSLIEAGSKTEAVENSIREYLLKNKRCKLPWTINEVYESIERFKNLLKTFKIPTEVPLPPQKLGPNSVLF
jgi:hypothetical protein